LDQHRLLAELRCATLVEAKPLDERRQIEVWLLWLLSCSTRKRN